jgi:uncharacterized membrane protein HdeD (DUF308 family)
MSASSEAVEVKWGWILVLGIALVVLGLVALGNMLFFTNLSMVLLGILLLIGGIVFLIAGFADGFWWMLINILVGIVLLIAGIWLIGNPTLGAITFTFVLALYWIVAGILKIVHGIFGPGPGKGWQLFIGIVDLVLGLVIYANWPISGTWLIGLFIGIDLILSGIGWIVLSFAARSVVRSPATS